MKQIIIAGCGGFGQEVYNYLINDISEENYTDISLIGVLDDSKDSYDSSDIKLPYLGSISGYKFDLNTYVILCVGAVKLRTKLIETLKNNNAKFFTYIHSSCYIAPSAVIGKGVIICPNTIINVNANIASHVIINVCSSIGHGASIAEGSILSPYSALNGDARVGKNCFLGTRATIYPQVSIADNCVVDTHSAVRKSVSEPSVISDRATYVCVPNRFY